MSRALSLSVSSSLPVLNVLVHQVSIQCQAQNYAELVTSRIIADMIDTTDRNVEMFANSVMTWSGVSTYANDPLTTSQYYTSSLPAVMLGVLNSTIKSDATLQVLACSHCVAHCTTSTSNSLLSFSPWRCSVCLHILSISQYLSLPVSQYLISQSFSVFQYLSVSVAGPRASAGSPLRCIAELGHMHLSVVAYCSLYTQ